MLHFACLLLGSAAATPLPCLDAKTTVTCGSAAWWRRDWKAPARVLVAFRGESFRGLSYGGPRKEQHACTPEAAAIQAATARAQLRWIVEPMEARGHRVDISLHTYACEQNATRLTRLLTDAYARPGSPPILRLLPRRGSSQDRPARDAAAHAASVDAAAVLVWRFDVVPGAVVDFLGPGPEAPFVAYSGGARRQISPRRAPRPQRRRLGRELPRVVRGLRRGHLRLRLLGRVRTRASLARRAPRGHRTGPHGSTVCWPAPAGRT